MAESEIESLYAVANKHRVIRTNPAGHAAAETNPFLTAAAENAKWEIAPFDTMRYASLDLRCESPSVVDKSVLNKNYNRYLDVLPNPRTRVRLPDIGDSVPSTYINANYIRSLDGTRSEFIACMGPLPASVPNFWRMVWQENVQSVVMATRLVERGLHKCHRYWPDVGRQLEVEGFVITNETAERDPKNNFLVSTIKLQKGEEIRNIVHYWLFSWPDHGVPKHADGRLNPDGIIDVMARCKLQQDKSMSQEPILVHCSAGVGRTGAIIALTYCMESLGKEGTVDPCAVIDYIREDRVALVQHPNQYELMYQGCVAFARVHKKDFIVSKDAIIISTQDFKKRYLAPDAKAPLPYIEGPSQLKEAPSDDEEDDDDSTATKALGECRFQPWYHGQMSRGEADDFFLAHVRTMNLEDGAFLVRESPRHPGQFAASVKFAERVFHYKITFTEGKFCTKEQKFDTLTALVTFYSAEKGEFAVTLREPVPARKRLTTLTGVDLNDHDFALMALTPDTHAKSKLPAKMQVLGLRKAGFLLKQGAGRNSKATSKGAFHDKLFARKNWKKRWFVLQDTIIKYYKTECDSCESALGYINLMADSQVVSNTNRSFSIVTPKRTYNCYADDDKSCQSWIDTIQAAVDKVQRCPPTAQAPEDDDDDV